MKNIIFINSHPIQYFAPMYKFMNQHGLKTKAWYCSDESLKGAKDSEFGINITWDIPLLEGYESEFFKNYSWKPSQMNGFFGLINLGMITRIFKEPKSVIIVHGWHYFTHFFILMLGRLCGHTVCLRNDMPQNQEVLKKGFKQKIKKAGLKYFLFPRIDYFLFIGTQNYRLFQSYGIDDRKMVSCPYAVDNERFRIEFRNLRNDVVEIKRKLGIPVDHKVILYSAKYIDKKRPLDLLTAFRQLNDPNCWLLMVGEGGLRNEMEDYIRKFKLEQIILTGFVNQSRISEFYAISDVFVMCSSIGENWGLSVNEAMNFGLPLILSDLTGCSDDLVVSGKNGYIFKTGDIKELVEKLIDVLIERKLHPGTVSTDILDTYSYKSVVARLRPIAV